MRLALLLLAALTLAAPEAWAGCALKSDLADESKIQNLIDTAYFVGFVRGIYSQEYPSGRFKEAGLKPFMVYRADPELDLSKTIVIKSDDGHAPGDDPSRLCEYLIPKKGNFAEIVLVKDQGEIKILQVDFGLGEYLKKHRENIRYVQPEDRKL
ncbi:MAG: hypothetical protein KJ017_09075 [Alphaproteobacteria bacterium]|nr:hypothetical protein [Alphaproteobacteria bacterium]